MYRVTDLQKSAGFYTKVLGLKQVWEDKERNMIGFIFPKSDAEIVIHANPDLPSFDYCYLVNDVTDACREFEAAGYTVKLQPVSARPGKYAILQDPDGNEIPIIDLTAFGGVPRYDK